MGRVVRLRTGLIRAGLCVLLYFADQVFASLAVETHAAGTLLSPSGAVPLQALVVAGLFLGCRLLLALVFCGAAAFTASDLVRVLFRGRAGALAKR